MHSEDTVSQARFQYLLRMYWDGYTVEIENTTFLGNDASYIYGWVQHIPRDGHSVSHGMKVPYPQKKGHHFPRDGCEIRLGMATANY
jgi:hypothetical protein